ncbi:MAG: glycosyltransferase family 2 protein [Bacteriovoracia bacterium]
MQQTPTESNQPSSSDDAIGQALTTSLDSQKDVLVEEEVSPFDNKDRHRWMKKNSYYYKDLERLFSFHVEKDATVLEIGYGVGQILDAVSPKKGAGLDISKVVAGEAKKLYSKYEFSSWNGEGRIPASILQAFPNGVDYILLVNAPGIWQDIQQSLELLRPICHENTRIIATYYNFLWAPVFRLAQTVRLKMPQPALNWLSADDVQNLFELSNYRVVKKGYRCFVPFNLGFISNFLNRYIAPLPLFNFFCSSHFVIARPKNERNPSDITVSVVIPARNERGNIEPAVRRMAAVANHRPEKYELIFVEGNSRDETWEEIQRVIKNPRIPKPGSVLSFRQTGKGKGDAVRLGFSHSTGDLVTILDADLTMPPEDLPKFVDAWCNGHGEFINGCRLVYKMEKEAMRPLNLMGNKFFSWAFTWILGQRFKDTLCGTKLLSRKNYERIANGRSYFGDFDPFGDFDLLFGASKLDLEFAEVPIRYRERKYGSTNISRWRHGWLLLQMCLYALRRIKFVP